MPGSPLDRLLARLGPEIEDPDEETFLLFAHERPTAQNLGFVDAHASELELTVAGRDLTIHQSPAVLTSQRSGGTTGAVLWKITPVVAEWLARPDNLFFCDSEGADSEQAAVGVLGPDSAVLELGCGISAVIGLALAGRGGSPGSVIRTKKKGAKGGGGGFKGTTTTHAHTNTVARYVLTDQPYVAKLVQRNLEGNGAAHSSAEPADRDRKKRSSTAAAAPPLSPPPSSIYFRPLDWETDQVTSALLLHPDSEQQDGNNDNSNNNKTSAASAGFDAVLACDCIYNDALVGPLVQTCADACRLRTTSNREAEGVAAVAAPTLCIIAQQLREPDVLTAWLVAFQAAFRVWRVPDAALAAELRPTAGFAVHVGILREA